jgi:hypothetical protein
VAQSSEASACKIEICPSFVNIYSGKTDEMDSKQYGKCQRQRVHHFYTEQNATPVVGEINCISKKKRIIIS